jgi:hypothetical protein
MTTTKVYQRKLGECMTWSKADRLPETVAARKAAAEAKRKRRCLKRLRDQLRGG